MVVVVGLAFLGGVLMAWAIGATNAPAFGPVNAAHAATIYRGSVIVGVASFLGAVTQGGAVADTMGRKLIAGATLTPEVSAAILILAAILIIGSTLASIPLPSAFLVVGGTIGGGIAIGGTPDPATVMRIGAVWLLIPFVGMGIGYGTARALRRWVDDTPDHRRRIRHLLLVLGAYTAYTAGANQAGLPIGPLLSTVEVPLILLLAVAGAGMAVGAWTGSPRIIRAVSQDYSRMGPRRAVGALLAASLIAQTATLLGVPISFGQTVIFSVIGAGLVDREAGVGVKKLARTVGMWVVALTVSTSVTYGVATLLTA